MSADRTWLPPLVKLADHGGDWNCYVEAVYEYFRRDFIESRPRFPGRQFAVKRHPVEKGKEATFWHLISEGRTEADRLPDMKRCERIRWPRPVIEAVSSGKVKCWWNKRGAEDRIVVALSDFSYVVVLADRGRYVLLWTAYPVEQPHRRRKLEKEHRAYVASHK